MEHYVILLITDGLSSEEQSTVISIIKALTISEEQKHYCSTFASHIVPFMNNGPLNVAVIGNPELKNQKTLTWSKMQVVDEDAVKSLISEASEKFGETVPPCREASYYPEVLHSFADQLPVDGTYKCDVIISSWIFHKKVLRDYMHFAAALYRYRMWHNAVISIIQEISDDDDDVLKNWCEAVDAHVISRNNFAPQDPVLWRGGMQIGLPDAADSMYLHGFQLEFQTTTTVRTWFHILKTACIESALSADQGSLIVSSKLEVLDECDMATIPPYMMTPVVFHLSLAPCEGVNEQSHQFLKLVNKKPKVAFILRLQYSQVSSPLEKSTKTFKKWKEAAISGDMGSYNPELPSSKQHLNFVLTKGDCPNKQSAVAYLMRDVDDIKGDFHHKLAVSDLSLTGYQESELHKDEVAVSLNSVPHFNVPLSTFLKVVNEIQLEVLQSWLEHKKNAGPEDGRNQALLFSSPEDGRNQVTLGEIKFIFSRVQDIVHSKFMQNKLPQEIEEYLDSDITHSEFVDPSDWPERIFLLQQQMLADKNKKRRSTETLAGLSPPAQQKKNVGLSAKDMMDYFVSSGKAKNQPSDKVGILPKMKRKNKSNALYTPLEEVLQLKWPDVLISKCHDMYYNGSNSCEDLEAECNRIAGRFVVNETASTCSNQPLLRSFSFLGESDSHSKENRLPQNEAAQRGGRGLKRKISGFRNGRVTPSDFDVRDKKLCMGIRLSSSSSFEGAQQMPEMQHKSNRKNVYSNTLDLPLRRSPRKLVRINYKQSPSHAKSKTVEHVQPTSSDDLSEKHKLKLRYAVVNALEQHGISLDHPAFKQCGKKLFAVCKAFVNDVIGKGSTSSQMKKIAEAHVKQVIEFEMQKGS